MKILIYFTFACMITSCTWQTRLAKELEREENTVIIQEDTTLIIIKKW